MQRHLLEEMLSLLRPPLCLARRSDQAVHTCSCWCSTRFWLQLGGTEQKCGSDVTLRMRATRHAMYRHHSA